MKKKALTPVVLDQPFRVWWPGFTGDASYGESFMIKWPEVHPDSHCEGNTYKPDEDGVCESCGWAPDDAICCEECNQTFRYKEDKKMLVAMITQAQMMPMERVYSAYIAYCLYFQEQLEGTPDLDAVAAWFEKDINDGQRKIALDSYKLGVKAYVIVGSQNLFEGFPELDGLFDRLQDLL